MDSDELNCLINQNSVVFSRYTGQIYSYDTLPTKLVEKKFYICNDKSSSSDFSVAGHWICLLYYPDYLIYVDSFGLPVAAQFILPLLAKCDVDIIYMNYKLQNIQTTSCGLHCLTFCSLFSFGWDLSDILENCYQILNPESLSDPYFFDHIAQMFVLYFYGESRSIFYEF